MTLTDIARDLVDAGYTEPQSLVDLSEAADEALSRILPPIVLIHVDGGIAEVWYVVEGTGVPEVFILDFDRDEDVAQPDDDFIETAREVLAVFKARGVDTSDLDADLDDMVERWR